jgi:hypothetical protein
MHFEREKIEQDLRKVLREQLRITCELNDNLVQIDPDFPTDEVIQDVCELLDRVDVDIEYENWNGTLAGLVEIIDAIVNK